MAGMILNFVPLSGNNLAAEITGQIRHMLETGSLNRGDKLPSTRVLARDLDVARGTVVAALDTLIAEGFLVTRRGSGTYVSEACIPVAPQTAIRKQTPSWLFSIEPDLDQGAAGALNFQVCRPSLVAFPQNAWRRAAADAASRLPSADYGDPQGELELRIAIAAYLCRGRGLDVNADEIIITNGAVQAMHIISRLYLDRDSAVAFEDPGYPLARQTFGMTGASILPIPIDEDGLRVDQLPGDAKRVKFVYVTPSHQFPTGERLSLSRRQELLEWATQNDVLILEDDYDGEFRYDVAPLPPLAAMSTNGFVVYFGTFSKTMFPSLRIGFAVGPKQLIKEMAACRAVSDYQTNSLTQLALTSFIENGEFEKHVHRMRRLYAKKRKRLREVMNETNLAGDLTGTDSGLNALIRLRTDISATQISLRSRLRGIEVTPISRFAKGASVQDNALVLGYGALSEDEIEHGVSTLAAVIDEAI